jgi:hypothetical protein
MPSIQLRDASRSQSAWKSDDLVRLVTTTIVAVAVMIIAWRQALGETTLEDQILWANLSVGGMLLAGYGFMSWILRGRRAIGERRRELLGDPVVESSTTEAIADPHSGVLVAIDGRRYFHRASCPLTDGRPTDAASQEAHEAAGRTACGVCRP